MRRSSCLLLAVLLLGGLLLALDRGAAWAAGRVASSRADAAGAAGADVRVRGFPFLTQLLRRDVQRLTLTARSVTRGGVGVQDVSGELRDVRPTSWTAVRAGSVAVRATVPFAELERRAGLRAGSLSGAGGTTLQVRLSTSVLGRSERAVVTAGVSLHGDDVVVTPRSLALGGLPGDASLLSLVRDRLTVRVRVPALPRGVRLTGLAVLPAGVRVDAAGTDVVLAGGSGG